VLLSFVYAGSGLAAGYSMKWWPVVAGFVVAWLLKLAGHDPDKPLANTLPARESNSDGPSQSG
jgi:hypothetical protein